MSCLTLGKIRSWKTRKLNNNKIINLLYLATEDKQYKQKPNVQVCKFQNTPDLHIDCAAALVLCPAIMAKYFTHKTAKYPNF